jgi:hypothetical protein
MLDSIGQEIEVGDKVAHFGMQGASLEGVYEVVKISEKRATVLKPRTWGPKGVVRRVPLDPSNILVVTMNLAVLDVARIERDMRTKAPTPASGNRNPDGSWVDINDPANYGE